MRLFKYLLVGMSFGVFFYSLDANAHHRSDSAYDYIIIGDGTAGAVLADKLSENHRNSVLVLEWGQNRTDDPLVLSPNPNAPEAWKLTYDPKYAITQNVPFFFDGEQPQYFTYSDGRMWGGSSAHHGLFAVRGTPSLYDAWAFLTGEPSWSYSNLLPLILGMEHYTPNGTLPNITQRGLTGPVSITQSFPINQDAFALGVATATNSPIVNDYNDPAEGNIGISAHQQFITPPPFSYRSFSANAYQTVGEVVSPKGKGLKGRRLKIESNALVSHVLFKRKKAIGVEYWQDGHSANVKKAYAKKKVIICAGTVQTSAILERSGIGDQARLKALDIDVVYHNSNVGEHLLNHYGVGGLITGQTSASPYLSGFINASPFMPNDNARRLQLIGINLPAENAVSLSGLLMHPRSEGSTHIVSKNPSIYPVIDLNMFSDGPVTQVGSDAYLLVSFYKILDLIAANLGTTVIRPNFPGDTIDENLLAYAKDLSNNSLFVTYHLVGSARMSSSSLTGVVDGRLNVYGVKDLMVADCSIQPFIEDGNTGYSALLIGLNAAELLK